MVCFNCRRKQMPRNVLTGLGMGTFTNIGCNISQDKSKGKLSLGLCQLTNICTPLYFEQNTSVQYMLHCIPYCVNILRLCKSQNCKTTTCCKEITVDC